MDDIEKRVIDLKLRIAEMKMKLFPPQSKDTTSIDLRAKLKGTKK